MGTLTIEGGRYIHSGKKGHGRSLRGRVETEDRYVKGKRSSRTEWNR